MSRISYATQTETKYKKRPTDLGLLTNEKWFDESNAEYIDLRIDENCVNDVEEWIGVNSIYRNTDGWTYASANYPSTNGLFRKSPVTAEKSP